MEKGGKELAFAKERRALASVRAIELSNWPVSDSERNTNKGRRNVAQVVRFNCRAVYTPCWRPVVAKLLSHFDGSDQSTGSTTAIGIETRRPSIFEIRVRVYARRVTRRQKRIIAMAVSGAGWK
jgi:hypothetical protein